MFVQFYRSKIRISEMWKFLETIFSICLQFQFPSLFLHSLPSGKFYLRFWIIILQKMLEWQRRSDKSLSESLGKFVIICTLTLSPGGEICRGTGTAIPLSPLFLIILLHNNCKICVSSSAHSTMQCRVSCSAPPIVAIFPYLLCMGQYSNIFSFQLYSIYPILVFWCCFQYLTGGKFKTAARQENIVKLKFISSNKVESFVWEDARSRSR